MLAAALLPGCNSTGCTDNRSALPLAGFYAWPADTELTLDSLDLGGVGAPGDSMLVHAGQSASQAYLPFRIDKESTTFFLHYDYPAQGLDDPAFNDTVTFAYTSEPYFASEECGAMYKYHVTSVNHTRHLIERVEVVDSTVTNVELERFKIYFRVAQEEAPEPPAPPQSQDEGQQPASARRALHL